MNLFEIEFATGDLLRAANVTNPSLQTWIRRELIVGHKVDMPGGPGTKRQFSFFNIMEVATAKALIDVGLQTSNAFQAAGRFAHMGSGRLPSLPAPGDGKTLLCVAGSRSVTIQQTPTGDAFGTARHLLGKPPGFVVLDISELFDRVCGALGFHPEAVLAQAYPDGAA